MTPLPTHAAPKMELMVALESAAAQLDALSRGEHEMFLDNLPAHQVVCLALESVHLGPGDRAALEQLITLNNTIMLALSETQAALREQMSQGRAGAKLATAYLR